MPEGTTFTFSQPHAYDSLTNDYYFGQTIPHPSHVAALTAAVKKSRETNGHGFIQLNVESTALDAEHLSSGFVFNLTAIIRVTQDVCY